MHVRDTSDLARRAFKGTVVFLIVLWVLIFLPAGDMRYAQGWLVWLHIAVWCIVLTVYFLKYDPALLERRLQGGPTAEREATQKRIQVFASIFVCALFVVSGLDHRFAWSAVPDPVVIAGQVLIALGFAGMFLVFRANSFASATIEVDPAQTVISTGPYGVVRHPMYAGAVLLFVGAPLALGSWWGLLFAVALAGTMVIRLLDEEQFLARSLPGYAAYCRKVRYRLVPGLW